MPLSLGMGGTGIGFGRHRTLLSKMPPTTISLADFKARLTVAELLAITAAAGLTPAAGIFPVDGNGMVTLTAPVTVTWVNLLVTLGIINQARATLILTP